MPLHTISIFLGSVFRIAICIQYSFYFFFAVALKLQQAYISIYVHSIFFRNGHEPTAFFEIVAYIAALNKKYYILGFINYQYSLS